MDGLAVFVTIAFIIIVWLIFAFYWLRIFAVAALLAGWGAVAIGAPVYLFYRYISEGEFIVALLLVVVSLIPGALWFFAVFGFILPSVKRGIDLGDFFKPWNSRG